MSKLLLDIVIRLPQKSITTSTNVKIFRKIIFLVYAKTVSIITKSFENLCFFHICLNINIVSANGKRLQSVTNICFVKKVSIITNPPLFICSKDECM